MTVQVNLLPRDYQLRAKRPARFRLWLMIAAAVAVAQVMSATFLTVKAKATRRAVRAASELEQREGDLVRELTALNEKEDALARKLALTQRLQRKHRWSRALSLLGAHMPNKVLLTRLETNPPRDLTAGANPPAGGGARKMIRRGLEPKTEAATARGLRINGIAADHDSVARFLGALGDQALFGEAELKASERQQFLEDFAIAFTIETTWQ